MNSFDSFTLTPMSAGDIIDRAVRIYRRNFPALLRIVLGPSLVAYAGAVLYYIGVRNFSMMRGDGRVVLSVLLIVSGFITMVLGKAAFYAVLGGASRSLVDHFFEGKPILARDVYRAVRQRIWSLLGATMMIFLMLVIAGSIIYFVIVIIALIGIFVAPMFSGAPSWLQALLLAGSALLMTLVVLFLILLIYSRVVYLPQVMMVEGKGVFNSISRSFSLAGGDLWRISALVLFWGYVAWSAWWLLYFPLGSVAYWMGVDPNPFNQNNPVWFNIAYQTLTQVSEILIAPIAMLGFTLLYLDSRVRKEGFDVELLANRLLPATAQVNETQMHSSVLFASPVTTQRVGSAVPSILGLNDYDYTPRQQSSVEPLPVSAPTVEAASTGIVQEQEEIESVATAYVPEEVLAMTLAVEPVITPEEILENGEIVDSTVEPVQRVCRWCGTSAVDEDRFCRVCGSVF